MKEDLPGYALMTAPSSFTAGCALGPLRAFGAFQASSPLCVYYPPLYTLSFYFFLPLKTLEFWQSYKMPETPQMPLVGRDWMSSAMW